MVLHISWHTKHSECLQTDSSLIDGQSPEYDCVDTTAVLNVTVYVQKPGTTAVRFTT